MVVFKDMKDYDFLCFISIEKMLCVDICDTGKDRITFHDVESLITFPCNYISALAFYEHKIKSAAHCLKADVAFCSSYRVFRSCWLQCCCSTSTAPHLLPTKAHNIYSMACT